MKKDEQIGIVSIEITEIQEDKKFLNDVVNLTFSLREADEIGEKIHPQLVMKKLGISYETSIPQTIGDCWWFLNCKNLPKELPIYLKELKLTEEQYNYWI